MHTSYRPVDRHLSINNTTLNYKVHSEPQKQLTLIFTNTTDFNSLLLMHSK